MSASPINENDPTAAHFGLWLSRQRKARDLTQEELADHLGCSRWTIQKIEVGNRSPSRQMAELLADYFHVPPDERGAFMLFARGRVDTGERTRGSQTGEIVQNAKSAQEDEAPARDAGAHSQAESGSADQGFASQDVSSPNNLPVQLTSFVGRGIELPRVRDLMLMSDVRLLTLTGAPGTGKTRLAIEVAAGLLRDFQDGVYFVNLAPVRDPGLLAAEIATELSASESPGQSLLQAAISHIGSKRMLLVLDNFEQIAEAAPVVGQLLAACPRLKVMVTSRAPLHIRGEKEFPVPPLYLPDLQHLPDLERLGRYEAVQLFVERAGDVRNDFALTVDNAPTVTEICVRLDGLPLAIELAAARVRSLPPQAMLPRLQNRLAVLAGRGRDTETRQQTLRGTIDWSYNLLTEPQKLLFGRLATFRGGRTLPAIEAICNYDGNLDIDVLDGVDIFVSNSLMQQREGSDGEPRFWMLETIHEYAAEKMQESGEANPQQRAHALYFMRLAEQAQSHLRDSQQEEWLNRLEDEHDNIRAALEWARERAGERTVEVAEAEEAIDVGLRLGAAVADFWQVRGYSSEGREQLKSLLEVEKEWEQRQETLVSPELKAHKAIALHWAGMLALAQWDLAAARSFHEASLAMKRELGDRNGMATSLNILGSTVQQEGNLAAARTLYEESLTMRRELGDKRGIGASLNNLGVLALTTGDFAAARTLYEESLAIRRELGDKRGISASLNNLGNVALARGDFAGASALQAASLAMRRELGDKRGIAVSLSNLGNVTRKQHDYPSARAYYEESLAIFRDISDRLGMMVSLAGLGGTDVGVAIHGGGVVLAASEVGALLKRGIRLLGAVGVLLESAGGVVDPEDREAYETVVAEARTALAQEAFEQAWQDGRAMNMQQAIEYALSQTAPAVREQEK